MALEFVLEPGERKDSAPPKSKGYVFISYAEEFQHQPPRVFLLEVGAGEFAAYEEHPRVFLLEVGAGESAAYEEHP
jgi:hypothetical protein